MLTLNYNLPLPLDTSSWPAEWAALATCQRADSQAVEIYNVALRLRVDDGSYRYRAIMGHPQLVVKFEFPEYVNIPVGAWCLYQGQRYTLRQPVNIAKQGTRHLQYTLTMTTPEALMDVWKLRCVLADNDAAVRDDRLKFSLTATPQGFLNLVVRNLREKDPSSDWQCGEAADKAEKCLSFNHNYVADALSDIATAFDTEWEVTTDAQGRSVLHIRKVEHGKDDPLPLSYGRGNGFVPGVGRTTEADGAPVGRMYVEGSDRNIDRATYGSPTLLLPKGATAVIDGATYRTSDDGTYLERSPRPSYAVKEDSYDGTEIYPSRKGEITAVAVVDADNNFYDFTDASIPAALDYNDCRLLDGTSLSVIFQDGMLAGKEFDVNYHHGTVDGKEARRFEIVPQEVDGTVMPDATFCPKAGDHYAVFGIQLPKAYLCDNDTQSGTSWDLLRAAAKALHEASEQRFTFTGQLQGLWAREHWDTVGPRLVPGGYILFSDTQFAPQGTAIRITAIKDYLNRPYEPVVELSNNVTAASVSSQLRKGESNETAIDDARREAMQFTRRSYRQAAATAQMIAQAALDRFSQGISPVTVATMSALIGDESLQFRFALRGDGDAIGTYSYHAVSHPIAYNTATGVLTANMRAAISLGDDRVFLQHYTIGGKTLTTAPDTASLALWPMTSYTSPVLNGEDKASQGYFLYARCNRTDHDEPGTFVLSPTAIKMDAEDGYWHFLTGVLTAQVDGQRAYSDLYGYTEILPGRINTDLIVSSDGRTYFDLATGEIGGVIKFLSGNGYDTLIDGGKIRTRWLDADNFTARRVEVTDADSRKAIRILPSEMAIQISNAQGVETARLDGESHTSLTDIFGTGSGSLAIGKPFPTFMGLLGTANGATSTQEAALNTTAVLTTQQSQVTASATVTLTATAPEVSGSGIAGRYQANNQASVILALYVYTYDNQQCTGEPVKRSYITQTANSGTLSGSVTVPEGYQRLMAVVTMYALGPSSSCAAAITAASASYKGDFYRSHYFANGMLLGTTADDCLLAYLGQDGHMHFTLRSNGAGLYIDPTGITYQTSKNGVLRNLN